MYGQIDLEDSIAGTAFALSAAVTTGIATISIFGYDLSGQLFSLAGSSVTMAAAISVAALVTAYATNRAHGNASAQKRFTTDVESILKGDATVETYVAVATLAVLIGMTFDLMGVRRIVTGSPALGVAVLALESAGFYVLSWMG